MIRILKKSIDKNTAKFIFLLLIVTLATTGCVSTENPDTTNTDISTVFRPKLPEWVTTPKVQEGVVFGIGGDSDPDNAILESQLDIAFQINTQIKNIVMGRSTADNGVNKNIASSIDEQTTLVTLFGAKIVEKFQSADGQTWILSRMPLNCVLDISQSVMISYALELNMEEEKIAELVKEVEESLASGRLKNPRKARGDYIFVKGGTFQMGSTEGASDEKPVHRVTVGSFYISKYEVTQGEYESLMGSNPSHTSYGIGDNYPVNEVSWNEALAYANALSTSEGLTPVYTISGTDVSVDWNANGYRLPTEAEWEYAARGGNASQSYIYSGSNTIGDVAWYWKNSGYKILSGGWDWDKILANNGRNHPVGGKQANELGLYDMSGNVWEWVWDWYGTYPGGNETDPTGTSSGSNRVGRGGSWFISASNSRSANRSFSNPSYRDADLGFRLVLHP